MTRLRGRSAVSGRRRIVIGGGGGGGGGTVIGGDVALDHYSVRSGNMTSRLNDTNPITKAIANGIHTGWLGDWMTSTVAQNNMAGWVTAAAGKPFTVALYAIPNRDSGGYSAGGFADRTSYLAWITAIRNGSGSAPVWYIMEPDALGQSNNFTSTVRAERQETIRQAVVILKQNPNAKVYLDGSMWIGADAMAGLMTPAGASVADGFSCNVSNFNLTSTCTTWAESVLTGLVNRGVTGKGYVVDTSRNGNGLVTSEYPQGSVWINNQRDWCNPPGRGIGPSARKPAAFPNCHGYLWIKMMGESDGDFPTAAQQTIFTTNAPSAGTWWQQWWDDFVAHSNIANASVPTAATDVVTPGPVTGPVTITTGGTYTLNISAPDYTVSAVTISTSQPVTIQNSTINHAGWGIEARYTGCQVTVVNSTLTAITPPNTTVEQQHVISYEPAKLTVQNNRMNFGHGVQVSVGTNNTVQTNPLNISNNDFVNIGKLSQPGVYQGAIHLDKVTAPNGKILWNRVTNSYGSTWGEDEFGLAQTRGTVGNPIEVGYNLINGIYPLTGNGASFTGGAIDLADISGGYINCHHCYVVNYTNNGIMQPTNAPGVTIDRCVVVYDGIADNGTTTVSSTFGQGITVKNLYDATGSQAVVTNCRVGHRRWSGTAWETTNYQYENSTTQNGGGNTTLTPSATTKQAAIDEFNGLVTANGVTIGPRASTVTPFPPQPGLVAYGPGAATDVAASWAQPGAFVVASRGNYAGQRFKDISAAGGTVLLYIDPIVWAVFGSGDRYSDLLFNASVYGAAVPKWPGPINANSTGDLADFRVGGILQSKWEAVLRLMISENPHMAGWFIDDCGSRAWFPNFNWTTWTAAAQQEYRAGAVQIVQTARKVADEYRLFVMVNGTWGSGNLAANGGGYPDMLIHGNALADGGVCEHHIESEAPYWNEYASSPQWGAASVTTGAGKGSHLFIADTAAIRDFYTAGGKYAFTTSQTSAQYDSVGITPWGSFHTTGLPSKVTQKPQTNPAFVSGSARAAGNVATASWTCPAPSGLVAGNLLIAFSYLANSGAVTPDAPAGWTSIGLFNTASGGGLRAAYKYVTSGEQTSPPTNYTFTGTGTASAWYPATAILQYSNVPASNPIDVSASNLSATGTLTHDAPTVTTTVAPTRLVTAFGAYNPAAMTSGPLGMDIRASDFNSGNEGIYVYDEPRTATGATGVRTATSAATDRTSTVSLAIKSG